MKKPAAAFASTALSVLLAFSSVPVEALAEAADTLSAGADSPTLLTVEANAFDYVTQDTVAESIAIVTEDGQTATTNVQSVCEQIYTAYDSLNASITFGYGKYTASEVLDAIGLVVANPEYYWTKPSFRYSYYDDDGDKTVDDDEYIGTLYFTYLADSSTLSTMQNDFEAKVEEAMSWVDVDEMSEFEVVQALHDYLVRNCTYDTNVSSDNNYLAYTSYGALVGGNPVCQGYALAYKLLLSRLGIGAVYVTSSSMNHGWNLVQMDDGNWYHVDVTWDDPLHYDSSGEKVDGGFDGTVSHTYFLRSDSNMTTLAHSGWTAAYTTPDSDYPNRTYGTYNGPVASNAKSSVITPEDDDGSDTTSSGSGDASGSEDQATYDNCVTAAQNGVTFSVEWNNAQAGTSTTFHVSAAGGSDNAKARMDVPTYKDPDGSQESVCDPSRGSWTGASSYKTLGADGYDFTFDFTASGTYVIRFYFMDTDNSVTYLSTSNDVSVTIDDAGHPAVSAIVANAVAQAKEETDGTEYEMALWLHDWELAQLDYDYSLEYCSAESGLTRGKGTCESFQRIYQKLLSTAGIENARMTGNGHTWNAVKIDGKWCQVDVNWDDTDYSSSYGFDSTHLYFGLTDELMAIAHSAHATTYQADGYAYRSTDLGNNYFVRSGQAAEWASAYVARIQEQLNAKATSFTIDTDNATNPPSICGIQHAIIAYALNQMTWTTSDGTSVTSFVATSNVTTTSSTSWTAALDFEVAYEEKTPEKTDIAGATVSVADQTYTGGALTPEVSVTLGEKTLAAGTDYTVAYTDNVNAGTATVTVAGTGDYEGTVTATFKIAAARLAEASVTVAGQTYTGTALKPAPTVRLNGVTLKSGTDYSVSYANNVNAGTATVTVIGKGNYTGSAKATFKISAASIARATVTAAGQTYTGAAKKPAPAVTLNGKTLKSGTDYTVSYTNNVNAGTATVTVTGRGNYTGTATTTFEIAAKSLADATVSVSDMAYTGSARKPAPTVKLGTKTLKSGTDYTVAYANNVNAGTATVTITGKGNYAGTASATFKISAASISKATVTVSGMTYTGSARKPAPTVKLGSKTLKSGTDYTVSYTNNVNAGTATVTVTGRGNYAGTAKATFKISAASIAKASVTVSGMTYTGSARKPVPTVKLGTKTLKSGTDYTVSYTNNVNAGTATVTITGKGNYAGSVKKSFKISAASIAKATVTVADQSYNGKAKKPAPTVKLNGKTLKSGTDYTVSYSNNVKRGTATVTITGKGNYAGTVKKTFKIK